MNDHSVQNAQIQVDDEAMMNQMISHLEDMQLKRSELLEVYFNVFKFSNSLRLMNIF